MGRIKRFLTVLWLAGCPAGVGPGAHDDAGPAIGDGSVAGDGHVTNQDGGVDGGLQVATNDHCGNATPISLAAGHVDVAATTLGAHPDLAAPCGVAGTPDVFFSFTLNRREMVYADTFGASSNTTLFFANWCGLARTGSTTPGDAVCSSSACGTSQSQVAALLDPGSYYLVLAGQDTAATIHFQHAEVGSGTVALLPQGTNPMTGTTTSGSGSLYACESAGAENAYWWRTCPTDPGGAFVASTCSGAAFDTILSLQLPGTESVRCNDDSCSSAQSSVSANIPAGAGLFVIAVDGLSQAGHGDYTLTATRP